MARTIALKSVDMTTGSIPKKMLTYTIPLIIAGWLQIFYSAADLIVCGNYGSPNSVGAISATNSITYLIISVFIGFGVGANVAVSKAYGARNQANAEKIIGTTYMLAIVSSIVLAALGVSLSRVLLQALGTPEDIIDLSTTYMMIYFAGVPFNIFYNFGAS
jgi:Na+-driven multidrug efflux pump